jgi:hypothetical protein
MYHYVLPAPHVLLTASGPVTFITKYQRGDISYEDGKWRQRGVSFLRKLFSQESLGNPTREMDAAVGGLAHYISKHAPEVEEVPIGAIIVFTTKNAGELDVDESPIPAMHVTKLRGYFRQKGKREPLPGADYEALRAAFDEAAGDLDEEEVR